MSNDAKRYYALLGVDPRASDQAIRSAFRQRAKELHPDAQSGDATAFILLKRAYDTLCDPTDRAAYDRLGASMRRPAPSRPATEPAQPRRPLPLTKRPKPPRRSGVGIGRYVIAFIVMAAISLGGVQAMISLTEGPPSIQTRATPASLVSTPTSTSASTSAETSTNAAPAAPLPPGSTKSGFWDADPPPTRTK